MMSEGSRAPVPGAPAAGPAWPGETVKRARARAAAAEARLVALVYDHCGALILSACASSSVEPEFLGALVSNESGGDPRAARFEPSVYRHLAAVAAGASSSYAGFARQALNAEIADMLHPKSGDFRARYLTAPFAANHQRQLAALEDEALRELATSWGYTQIMGYHMIGRAGTVRDLLDPPRHFRIAIELLAEFIEEYQLDPAREFAEMFCCWNTGRPYGRTYDPHYVERGLARVELYRRRAALAASPSSPGTGAKRP
jgi:hypothetical protein